MTVTTSIQGGFRLPAYARAFADVEAAARLAVVALRTGGNERVDQLVPAATGALRRRSRARLTRTPLGFTLTVGPPDRLTWRARFIEEGTGLYGPRGQTLPVAERGIMPNGARPSGRGQRPQHVFRALAGDMETLWQAMGAGIQLRVATALRSSLGSPA